MANILFNKRHLKEYAVYGTAGGISYALSVWYFLHSSTYQASFVLFVGSICFMFIIMLYARKLTRRKSEYNSTWTMLIAGQMAVIAGIVVSIICSFALCCYYITGFPGGENTGGFLINDPNRHNISITEALVLIFTTATFENYVTGGLMSAIFAYAVRPDQTRDQTPTLFEERAESNT